MADAYSQFAHWLQEQPKWLQDAAWQIYHNQPTNEEHISKYANMCISEIEGKSIRYQKIDSDTIVPSANKEQLEIIRIRNIVGVNALNKDASLDFNASGISVVYGLNGAGKSGYMRIIKCACGTPYAEVICSNAFKKEKEEPSCVIDIKYNNQELSIPVKLNEVRKPDELSHCDVFDSMISGVYITKQTSVSYEPFVFIVLAELAKIAESIKRVLILRKEHLTKASIRLPENYNSLNIALWQKELSPETEIPEHLLKWEDRNEKRLVEIKALLDTETVEKRLTTLTQEKRKLEEILCELSEKISYIQSNENPLREELANISSTKAQADIAAKLFSDNADDIDTKSISNADWKNLWKTARKYYNEFLYPENSEKFGAVGAICPLCHQSLSQGIQQRFSSIDNYINGITAEEYTKAKNIFEEHLSKVLALSDAKTIGRIIDGLVEKELQDNIRNLFEQIDDIRKAERDETSLARILTLDISSVVKSLSDIIDDKQHVQTELTNALKNDEKVKLHQEMMELGYKKWLFEHRVDIQNEIDRLKSELKIENACSLLTTNKITIESNKLAQALITDAYIRRFSDELKILAPRLRVRIEKTASQKGKSPYKVVLDTEDTSLKNKPELVLSEGEQRIVAIAAFLADAMGRSELSPIVIDDPISSLDYNYEERATKRITQIAENRQVIIFTHRISLLVGIKEACEKINVDFSERHIRSIRDKKGIRGLDTEFTGKLPPQLQAFIDNLKKLDVEDEGTEQYEAIKDNICRQFRICVERAVEDVLLNGIVKRFDRIMHTKSKLDKLISIDKADCDIIDSMMTKYSFHEHAQPDDACAIDLSVDEIIQDIDSFKQWIKGYNKKTPEIKNLM